MTVDRTYRLGIVRRSRHIGCAVLRGTTLVYIVSGRQTGRRPRGTADLVGRLCRDFPIGEMVMEPGDRALAGDYQIPVVEVSLAEALSRLVPEHPRPRRGMLIEHVAGRYPAVNHTIRRCRRVTRDRTASLYAVALALTCASATDQP